MQKKFINRVGEVYGKLTLIECTEKVNKSKGIYSTKYLCKCECGNTKVIRISSLLGGLTKSCGCYNKQVSKNRATTHGYTNTPTYMSWRAMKERCYNKNNKRYKNYGGKGICVCKEWLESFNNFLEDMGERPEGLTLDRINPKLDYYKDNCRWADNSTQAYNKNKESEGSSTRVGVSYHKRIGKWQARIRFDGNEIYLGYYDTEEDAISERERAELLYRKENLK